MELPPTFLETFFLLQHLCSLYLVERQTELLHFEAMPSRPESIPTPAHHDALLLEDALVEEDDPPRTCYQPVQPDVLLVEHHASKPDALLDVQHVEDLLDEALDHLDGNAQPDALLDVPRASKPDALQGVHRAQKPDALVGVHLACHAKPDRQDILHHLDLDLDVRRHASPVPHDVPSNPWHQTHQVIPATLEFDLSKLVHNFHNQGVVPLALQSHLGYTFLKVT